MVQVVCLGSLLASVGFATSLSTNSSLGGHQVASLMNSAYSSFDPYNPSSGTGLVVRTTAKWEFFCPGFSGYGGCYKGSAECASSASIMNNKMMIKNGGIHLGLERTTGIAFNPSLVEDKLGRCSYPYDGVTWGRYNHGCGAVASCWGSDGCCDSGAHSAFWNIDPVTGKEATPESDVVARAACENGHPPACFWKGAGFYPERGLVPSQTHTMLKDRFDSQGSDPTQIEKWNEVIIDAAKLHDELSMNPTNAVWGMLYIKGDSNAKNLARRMSEDMAAEFGMAMPVPLIAVDPSVQVATASPFSFEGAPEPEPTPTPAPRPSPQPSPHPSPKDPSCKTWSGCAHLSGNCCPHDDGTMLACCTADADTTILV